jgi:plasmid maintenance system killer protein
MRLRDLSGFESMADIPSTPPYRLHKWSGKRNKEWSIDIQNLYRIHFIPAGKFKTDTSGHPVLNTVTSIEIVDIGDYHGW